jgi:hypothetical protein
MVVFIGITPTFFLFGRLVKRSVIAPSGFGHKNTRDLFGAWALTGSATAI